MTIESAILIVVTTPAESGSSASKWILEPRAMVVGRHPGCDIYLPDRQISREHARLTRGPHGFAIEDLGSKNGTFVNGDPVTGPRILHDGDLIQVGLAYRLAFVGAEATVPLPPERETSFVLRLDREKKQVWVNGQVVEPPLSPAQFDLLEMLIDAEGGVVDRDAIAMRVWGSTDGVTEQAIDALVRRLRRRLADYDGSREFILTARGFGFRLEL